MVAGFVFAAVLMRDYFNLVDFTLPMIMVLLLNSIFSIVLMIFLVHLINRIFVRRPKRQRHVDKNRRRQSAKGL